MGRANLVLVRVAYYHYRLRVNHFGRAVGPLSVFGLRIRLDEHGIVYAVPKRRGDRRVVQLESVGRDLESLIGSGAPEPLDKGIRRGLIAPSKREIQDQLGVPLDCYEAISRQGGRSETRNRSACYPNREPKTHKGAANS